MADTFDHITPEQAALIRDAKLFFVASVAPDLSPGPAGQGPVNLSPKGGAPLHLIDDHCLAYLDFRGSGNETARHAQAGGGTGEAERGGPITLMVMSLDTDAAIVRLYGHATVTPLDQSPHAERLRADAPGVPGLAERQVVELRVESTATSCGYGVPVYQYTGDRTQTERGRRYK